MALATELSGVQAAQTFIDTVGNNVANADTTGFKVSSPDFSDLYAAASSSSTPGEGVMTASLAQSFAQGTINQTGNPLDVAISGNGFFQLQSAAGIVYSRNGAFHMDKSGNLATDSGALVLGFNPATGTSSLQPINISSANIPASATGRLGLNINLPATDAVINTTTNPFNAGNNKTYNESTSTAVYDSLGASDSLTTYYTAVSGSGSPPHWQTHWQMSSAGGTMIASGAGPTLIFNNSGQLVSGSGTITVNSLPDGAAPLTVALDYNGSTLSNLGFAVNAATNNGNGAGQFTGVQIASTGQVSGEYSNGATRVLGTIALANFANPQGLVALSDNVWASSYASGQAISGTPGSGTLGHLQTSALENSNVDLTGQLVNLIVAQQAYQANTQGINIEQQNFQKLMTIQ